MNLYVSDVRVCTHTHISPRMIEIICGFYAVCIWFGEGKCFKRVLSNAIYQRAVSVNQLTLTPYSPMRVYGFSLV